MMTMIKLCKNKKLRVPRIFGGQSGIHGTQKFAVLIMEDFSDRMKISNMADGANLPQVLFIIVLTQCLLQDILND